MDHAVPPDSPAPKRLPEEGFWRGAMKSTCPSPSPLCRGRNYVAGTWTHFTLLSLEKPPRHAPWRRCAWPTWLNALDWRISRGYSTSALDHPSPSPVDVVFSSHQLRYTEPRFRIWQLQPA